MGKHQIAILTHQPPEQCYFIDSAVFDVRYYTDLLSLSDAPDVDNTDLVVVDHCVPQGGTGGDYQRIHDVARQLELPVVVLVKESSLQKKLDILEVGINDVIPLNEAPEEITTRLLGEIYHSIADRQLKKQLNSANEAALAAMRESSNLGGNVHFLVEAHQCNNLDELGQLFFRSMKNYDLNCSLQMRSVFGVKNMETNGMARQLESELLTQLQDSGRFYDFGRRTVVNYGTVSVLIRNMPEDEALYGLVKDNTFTLIQGLDARVKALDGYQQLEQEKCALQRLSARVNLAMEDVNTEYQTVMRAIVNVVEDMAESIGERIPLLLLNEDQEDFIEKNVVDCVLKANDVFREGFRVDRHFGALQKEISHVIEQVRHKEQLAKMPESDSPQRQLNGVQGVELF